MIRVNSSSHVGAFWEYKNEVTRHVWDKYADPKATCQKQNEERGMILLD